MACDSKVSLGDGQDTKTSDMPRCLCHTTRVEPWPCHIWHCTPQTPHNNYYISSNPSSPASALQLNNIESLYPQTKQLEASSQRDVCFSATQLKPHAIGVTSWFYLKYAPTLWQIERLLDRILSGNTTLTNSPQNYTSAKEKIIYLEVISDFSTCFAYALLSQPRNLLSLML